MTAPEADKGLTAWRPGSYREGMSTIERVFATRIYRGRISGKGARRLNQDLTRVIETLAVDDGAGRDWSDQHDYAGYTSYASLNDLPWRFPEFASLQGELDQHVKEFVGELEFDLGGRGLACDSLWVNVLEPGGHHAPHIHPHSVISGTYYVSVPKGAAAIRFEDPRHAMMMAAPPRKPKAHADNKPYLAIAPKVGDVLLWESWLRHDVPMNRADTERVSISFNYAWGDGDGS